MEPDGPLGRLLVPVDFSPFSKHALRMGLRLARLCAAQVHLLHVVPEYEMASAFRIALPDREELEARAARWADRAFDDYLRGEDLEGVDLVRAVRYGKPAAEIGRYAREQAVDLVVIASHGRSGFERAVFGSVAAKVLHTVDRPVLVVKGEGPTA